MLRISGHQIFIMGSMNYIEREFSSIRPDIAIVGAGASGTQLYRYTSRLLNALGNPQVVLPSHWDDYGTKALKDVAAFASEVHASSPRFEVIIPEYFAPRSTFRVPGLGCRATTR